MENSYQNTVFGIEGFESMEEFIDFKIIKDKIIKTDCIINLFSDSKKKNAELRKALQLTHKKYKQSIDDIAILNLENDRKLHQSEEHKRELEKLRTDYVKLNLDYCSLKEEYNNNLNELQVLQIKYQSACKELVECQKSLDHLRNQLPVKNVKKRGKKKHFECLEVSETSEPVNFNNFPLNESCESEEEGKLLEMKLTEKSDYETELNVKQSKHFESIKENDKNNECIILDLKTEIKQLSAFSNILKEEVKNSNERKNLLIKEWEGLLKNKEAAWLVTEQQLRFEIVDLKKRLELYETQNIPIGNIKTSIFDCEEGAGELSRGISVDHASNLRYQQSEPNLIEDSSDNVVDSEIVCELPAFPECDHSDNDSVSHDMNDIFKEMRSLRLVSPMPPSDEDQISPKCISATRVPTKSEFISKTVSINIEPEPNSHVSVNTSNESNLHIHSQHDDKYNKLRQRKAKQLSTVLNIKKAKHLLWLKKSKLILLKSKNDSIEANHQKNTTCENGTDKSMKKNEQNDIRNKKASVDDIVTVLADLVSQKLRYPRTRKKSSRLNLMDSRNVLEVNKMLLKKAKQLITSPGSCGKKNDTTDIPEYDGKHISDVNATIHPDALVPVPIDIVPVEHSSNTCSSERSSSEVELPIFDSCYESLISNPPSIENFVDDRKGTVEWKNQNRSLSDYSNAHRCQSDVTSNKETANLNTDALDIYKYGCDNQDSSEIVSPFVEKTNSTSPVQNEEICSNNVREEVNSNEMVTYIVEERITSNEEVEKNISIPNEVNCQDDYYNLVSENTQSIIESVETTNIAQILDEQKGSELQEKGSNSSHNCLEIELDEKENPSENDSKLSGNKEDKIDVELPDNCDSTKEVGMENKNIASKGNEACEKIISDNSNVCGCQSANVSFSEETTNLHNDALCMYNCEYKEQDSLEIGSKYDEKMKSSLPFQNDEICSSYQNFKVKEEVVNSYKLITYNGESEITSSNKQAEKNSSSQNAVNCLKDNYCYSKTHNNEENQEYYNVDKDTVGIDNSIDEKVTILVSENTEKIGIVNGAQILDMEKESKMHETRSNSSQNSSELRYKRNKIPPKNCNKLSDNKEDKINDEGHEVCVNLENKVSNNIKKYNTFKYQKENRSTIQNSVHMRYSDDNTSERYNKVSDTKITLNESFKSFKSVSENELDMYKEDLAGNQKTDSFELQVQATNVNPNDFEMECGKINKSTENYKEFIQENEVVEINTNTCIDTSTSPKENNKNLNHSDNEFQIIENEISTMKSSIFPNEDPINEVNIFQVEDFNRRGNATYSNVLLECEKNKTSKLSDILEKDCQSAINSKNESDVNSVNGTIQNYQIKLENNTESIPAINSPIQKLETEDVNNCYKLFHYEDHNTNWNCRGLSITETVDSNAEDAPTSRSNESMWYEFSQNICNGIRISQSYYKNNQFHQSRSTIDCETDHNNKRISIKRLSEDEFSNISKISKLEDCDFLIESTDDSSMEPKDSSFESEKEMDFSESEPDGEGTYDSNESWEPLGPISVNDLNENNIISSETEKSTRVEDNNDVSYNIPERLNSSNDMQINLDISEHLLQEIEEEYLNEDSSLCVSSIINDFICESQRDVQKNYEKDKKTPDILLHHSVKDISPKLPRNNETCVEGIEKANCYQNALSLKTTENYVNSTRRVPEAEFSNDKHGNCSKPKTPPLSHNSDDLANPIQKNVCKNSRRKSKMVVRKYNLRKSAKLEDKNVVSTPVTEEILINQSLNSSNDNKEMKDENQSGNGNLKSNTIKNNRNINKEIDLIGSFSESSDNELSDTLFLDNNSKNCTTFTLKQTRKSKFGRLQTEKVPAKTKKGILMKKSIRTYKQKTSQSNLVLKPILPHKKETEIVNLKFCNAENTSGNTPLNGCKSYLNNNTDSSKFESNFQNIEKSSFDEKKLESRNAITVPQSSLFKRSRSNLGGYSITSVKRTCASQNLAVKTEEKLNFLKSSACSFAEEKAIIENKPKTEMTLSSNDFVKRINSLPSGDSTVTSFDKPEQNYDITNKKVRKSLVNIVTKNPHSSPSKTAKKSLGPRKRKSSCDVDHNIKPESQMEHVQSICYSNKLSLTDNRVTGNFFSKEEKINILQEVIIRPSSETTKPTKFEIKAPSQLRISGFKRPNNTKIIPACPMSPPPTSTEETDSYAGPVIIPLEKPPKLEPSKAAALFRKLITYSSEEKTVEEVARNFTNQDVDHIARFILDQITQDTEKPNKNNTSAPLMTDTQRVMLGFMLKLEQMNVENLINTYLKLSELRLLQARTLQEMETITRLHVAICKSHKYIERMRRMCCDAFYFMGDLAIPFFFIVLVSWIEVLPLEEDLSDFPMVKVLVQLVNLKDCNIPGFNLLHLRDLLNKYYKYPNEPWNSNCFFQELFNNYLRNPVRPSDFAILLYCKNNTSKWVYEKINNLLRPTLANIKNENFKATVIILMSNIISQFNGKEDGEYVDSIRQWFKSMIAEEGVSEVVKKSIILSLRKLPKTWRKPEINNTVQKR